MRIRPYLFLILYPPAAEHLRKPKVYQPYLNILRISLAIVLIEKDYIIEFDVPVDDVELMDVAERAEDFAHDGPDGLRGVSMPLLDVLKQRSALAVLSDDAVNIFVHICLVDLDDVWVIESLQQVYLIHQFR